MPKLKLNDALYFAQEHHIILRPTPRSIALWAPGVCVPSPIRETLVAHKHKLRELLSNNDIRTCPSPGLHRSEWYHAGEQEYCCKICQRLCRG